MSAQQRTILYLDDDRDYRDALRAVLQAAGYRMVEAASAEQGLEVLRESAPDVVLVDLMMEEVDSGLSFVKELRAQGHALPVYMLSSVGEGLSLSTDAAELGLAGVFQKPIDSKALLAALRARLEA